MAKSKNFNQISFIFNDGILFEHDVLQSLKNLPQGYKKQFLLKLIREKFADSKDLQSEISDYMGLRLDLVKTPNEKKEPILNNKEPSEILNEETSSEIVVKSKHAVIKNATF